MEVRRDLLSAFPILGQISAPDTDKDAFLPVHPGAAAYFNGNEPTFFDRYGDAIFYGSLLLGTLTSLVAAAWRFMGFGRIEGDHGPLEALYALADHIREATSLPDLQQVKEEIDGILKIELLKHARGEASAANAAALNLTARRLERLIDNRRSVLTSHVAQSSIVKTHDRARFK